MVIINIVENNLISAVGNWIDELIKDVEIIAGQQNKVPTPYPDLIVLTPIHNIGLSQNREIWDSKNKAIGNQRSTEWRCQIDVYGSNAFNNANILSTMVKTDWSCQFFKKNNIFEFQPLYATDPQNMTFISAEQLYEIRYSFDFIGQYNPIVSTNMDYFNSVILDLKEVDKEFPPKE